MASKKVIYVDENTFLAVEKFKAENDTGTNGGVVTKLMKEKGYLNKDGTVK